MFREKQVLGVIPARGNSKRLPKKNMRYLEDKPLIAWTIQAALDSKHVDKVVVSTENSEIARVATECGVHEVIQRSKPLSEDHATTTDVLLEVLKVLDKQGECFDYVALLQPTSPLRTAVHIEGAFSLMSEKNALGAVSVCATEHPVEWMGKISNDFSLNSFFLNTKLEKQSQELSPSFQINGAIYINRIATLLQSNSLINCGRAYAYIMSQEHSIDIDGYAEYILAGILLGEAKKSRKFLKL